ncbi:MAG: OsmC family protein, partial [Myxococcota bacterium]
IRAGTHRFAADEPHHIGGNDTGPNPYDLLLASLGSCTAMTLRMYADRKEWPLEEVSIVLSHERIHGEDSAKVDADAPRLERIVKRVKLTGDLSAEQIQRLLEIADRCPVHRTLHAQLEVRTQLDH